MILLRIQIYLELNMWLVQFVNPKESHSALVIQDVSLMLPFHLGFLLVPGQLVALIPLQVLLLSCLYYLLHLQLYP